MKLSHRKKLYSTKDLKKDLPTRKNSDNKTRGGRCLIVAGSPGMWGASILCATAAARTGAGYVYLLNQKGFPSYRHPDFLLLTRQNIKLSAIAIGPGLKNRQLIKSWIKKLIRENHPSVVLDAEALNVLSEMKCTLPSTWILTPHEGELARLLKTTSQKIQLNRIHYLKLAQDKFKCIVLLKGSQTLIADSEVIYEIQSGNPSLAKAGTGDVLTGMMTALLSQQVPHIKAAAAAAYIHGKIADNWITSHRDILSLMASDIVMQIPFAIQQLRSSSET